MAALNVELELVKLELEMLTDEIQALQTELAYKVQSIERNSFKQGVSENLLAHKERYEYALLTKEKEKTLLEREVTRMSRASKIDKNISQVEKNEESQSTQLDDN